MLSIIWTVATSGTAFVVFAANQRSDDFIPGWQASLWVLSVLVSLALMKLEFGAAK